MGIYRLLHFPCCFLNTITAITRQLILTARTLEAESREGKHGYGERGMAGRVWAAGFHNVTARSRLARVLKIMNSFNLVLKLSPCSKCKLFLFG